MIVADQAGANLIRIDQSSGLRRVLEQVATDGTASTRWTSQVLPSGTQAYNMNQLLASHNGAVYTVDQEVDGAPPATQTYTLRQHRADGAAGWSALTYEVLAMAADASGVFVVTVKPGAVADYVIRKFDAATGSEAWSQQLEMILVAPPPYYGLRLLAIGDGSLYLVESRAGGPDGYELQYVRRFSVTDGSEIWQPALELPVPQWQPPARFYGIAATSGGLYTVLPTDSPPTGDDIWGARVTRYGLDKSVLWTKDISVADESHSYQLGSIAADASGFYLRFYHQEGIRETIHRFDATGAETGKRSFPLTPSADRMVALSDFTAYDGAVYVTGLSSDTEGDDPRIVAARLLPQSKPRGTVPWSDAYPDRVGQGVQGATVKVGDQTFTTDTQGEYEIPSDLVGQDATVTLPIFDHSGAQALVDEDGALLLGKATTSAATAAGGSNISLIINEQIKLQIDPNTGKLKTTATFGKNVQFKGFGQTFNLTNLKLTDQGVQTVGGTAQLAFKYDANSPPIILNVTLNYVKASNELTINGVAGSQFQWGGQTATLTKFDLRSSPTINTVTVEGTMALKLSNVPITATLKGTGTAQGVVLTAVGTAVIQGITLTFDPITVENGQFRVKGRVKLPNQPFELAFDTTTGLNAPRLILPLPQFQWDGQTLPLRLELLGSAMILAGEGAVQIGGQSVTLKVDTQFNALSLQSTTVRVEAVIPLPEGGQATAKLEYNPTQPQNSAVTGTMKVFLALCPGQKTDFNVEVRASAANIRLGFRTQLPVDCDGNGTSTLVDINGDFDGQLAQLQVSWPVTVGNSNGRVSATVKSDGTFFQIMFNVELKFGPGGAGSSSAQAHVRANAQRPDARAAAASDVRILLTDGAGRRTGYDPATRQIVNEIPGGGWTGMVNGMDTFTMPGRVGGYAVTLFSQTPQQVTIAMTVGGQTKTFTSAVGPNAPTTLAAETVPQNGGVVVQIGPAVVGCSPRPPVRVAPAPGTPGALQATFTAAPGSSVATNAIREIRIGQIANGVVDADGRTGLGSGSVITFPSPVTSVTLTIRRANPGQSTTVPLTIVDGCGEWQTFVGGGANAF